MTSSDSKLRPWLNDKVNTWMTAGEETFINDCINETDEFVQKAKISPKDKKKMSEILDEMRWTEDPGDITLSENDKRKEELGKYIYNAILKFEGHGVRN